MYTLEEIEEISIKNTNSVDSSFFKKSVNPLNANNMIN